MVLLLQLLDTFGEFGDDWINVFKVVLLESVELSDRTEELDQFANSTTEEFELAEDLVEREVELFCLWHGLEALLCEPVLSNVCVFQVLALSEHGDQLIRWVF